MGISRSFLPPERLVVAIRWTFSSLAGIAVVLSLLLTALAVVRPALAQGVPGISIDSPSVSEGDSDSTNLTFTVTLSAASGQQVTVAYADAGTGTATSGTDYTAITGGALTFAAGTTSQTFDVSVTGDTTDEADETVVVTLSNAANAAIGTATGTGTITDNDLAPTVTLSVADDSISENGGSTTVSATLSHASSEATTITISPLANAYTVGSDATIAIAAGETENSSDTATINAVDNDTGEADRSVIVTGSAINARGIGQVAGASLTLEDDDGAGPSEPQDSVPTVSISSPSVSEGNSGSTIMRFTVTLSAASSQQVTVAYADAGTGTATSGTDYTAITGGTLTIAAGTMSQTFDVSVIGDTTDEADETIVVTLSNATNATIATATGTGTIRDNDAPTLSIDSPSVTEGDSGSKNLTFTVTLSAASSQQVTVFLTDYGLGTATPGTDYTAFNGGTLTIAAGTTSQTLDVSVTGDVLDEPDETVVVVVNNNSSLAAGTGTIKDNDATPTLSIDSPSVSESRTFLTFTVTLSAASGRQVTVAYADAGTGTATSGTDYEAITGRTLTFAAGTTSKSFIVRVRGDALDEANRETVVVTLSSATNATIATATGTGTIWDNDSLPTLSIDSPSVTEGDSGSTNLTFTVTLSAASGRQVTVDWAEGTGGTATSGTDYTAITGGALTFAAGTTSQTFDVAVTGDTDEEQNETVVAMLSNAANATISTATGTGMIVNDDGVTVSIDSPRVTEGDSGSTNLRFTATLNKASTEQVTVNYADAGTGTATSGTDYTAITGGTLTFAAGTTSQTLDVSVTGDTDSEANETVVVTLSGATNATIATATGTGTIVNDDGVLVSIDSPRVTEGDSRSANLTFTVTLNRASTEQVTVNYADAGTGTAMSGTDYTAITGGTLTFAVGTTSQTFDVSVTGDYLDEADETVVVTLSNATNAMISTATGTGTIWDNNDRAPTLSIDSPSVTEGDSGSTDLTFTAMLSAASGQQVTVVYADAGTGTATSGTDYTAITGGTLTFAAGTTSQTFNVSVIGDTDEETNETVVAILSNAVNATISTATGTGTIVNDDGVTVSIDSPSVTEGDSGSKNLTFTATLNTASTEQVTVDYADARTGTAASGRDYTAITGGTLTFAVGTTSQTFSVSVTGDVLDEPNETVVVSLSGAVNATISTASGTGTIMDDDATPTLSIDSPSVTEGNSGSTTLTFTATLSAASGQQVTVAYADAGTGTATSGTDYRAITGGTLTFTAGTTSRTFDVGVTGDTDEETNETVVAILSNAVNATISTATGTGTIVNDDGVTVSIDSPSVAEGDSGTATLTFTVTLSAASGQQVTVAYADAGTGTATSGTDYTAITGGTLTFAAGTTSQTFDVSVTGDTDEEPNETVVTTLSSAANATISTATGTGTITDDDRPTLSIDSPSVTEGNSGSTTLTFTATLSAASGQQVTVDWAEGTGGTATSGTDYTAITGGTLTFAAGTTSQTFDVSVTGDTLDESNETVVVTLSSPTNATISTASGTGTITDDDGTPTLSIDSPSVAEGDSGTATLTFTATLSAASGKQVTVDWAEGTGGTATSGTDYTAIAGGTLIFTAGQTRQTFDVSVTGDVLAEANETVVMSLSNARNATIGTATGTGTITDDDAPTSITLRASLVDGVGEGDGPTFITVVATVDGATRFVDTRTVRVSVSGSGTPGAVDFAAVSPFDVTIPAGWGDVSKSFRLTPTDDSDDETDETITVSGTSSGLTVNPDTFILWDNDGVPTSITLSTSLDDISVTEHRGPYSVTVTATLNGTSQFTEAKTVRVSVAGTLPDAVKFAAVTDFNITIAAGEASGTGTFTLTPTNDRLHTRWERIKVSGTSSGLTVIPVTFWLVDDDEQRRRSITLTVDDDSVSEGDGPTTITVTATLDARPGVFQDHFYGFAQPVIVSVAGSGTAGAVDFAAVSGFNFSIAAGETSGTGTFTLTPTDDSVDETDETVTLSGTSYASALRVNPATITITDNDAAPTSITLTVDDNSVAEDDGATTITVTATVDGTTRFAAATTVTVSVAGSGTATAVDFAAVSDFNIAIAAGAASQTGTFTLTPTDDALDEANETVTVSGASGSLTVNSDTITLTDDDPTPTLSIDSPSVTEGDSGSKNLRFTVTLSPASGQQVTVQYADAGTGTATSGTDYTAIAGGTLTFAAGTTSQTLDVSVTGDTDEEPNETVVATLSNAANATISTATGTGTITDDDRPAVSLSLSPASVSENAGVSTVTATLSEAVTVATTITVSAAAGTGADSSDFTLSSANTLTIAAGETTSTGTVTVTAVDNALDEPDKRVTVSGAVSHNGVAAPADEALTITDDDPAPTLSVDSPSVTEGDSGSTNLTFTATLSAASGQQVTVAWADAGTGTATSGTDYTAITGGSLTFAVGATSQTFDVSVTGDTTDEADETVVVTLSDATNATISTATGTGTIVNDDGVTVSIDSPSVTEGDSGSTNLTFTVTLSAASSQRVTVDWAEGTGGTATSVTDYTAITGGTLTFPVGTTSQTFDVSVTGDTDEEPNETVVATLSNATNATIATATGTGTIVNDDGVTVSIDSPSVTEGDSGSTNLRFTATLSKSSADQVTVDYADAGTGTATSGTDYRAITGGTLTFAAGTTSQTFDVSVTGDTDEEPNETVVATLSNATNATIATAPGTGTIVNDDGVTVSIDSPSVTEGDSGSTTLRFTATLSESSADQVTVDYADAGTGTATSGTDYTAITGGTLTFAAGTTSQTFDVSVTGDTTDEADETVVVTLSNAANATISTATGTGTITDDDGITVSIDSPSVTEGDSGSTTLTFTVTLSAASGRQVTVAYADAGTGTATSGTDYTAITGGTLTFAAGITSQTFDVSVTGDALDESNETVVVTLSNATNATIATTSGTGTITDDDGVAPTLSIDSPRVTEGDSGSTNLTFTATLSAASGQQVTVAYADAGTGTATSGTDYTAITGGTLTFAVGTTSQTFTVAVTGDTTEEPNETVVVTLSSPTNATIATATGIGTITDDDRPILSIDSPSVVEGDSGSTNLTFTVTLSKASTQQVTVRYSDGTTGTATSGTDYTAITGGALTFAAGTTSQTFDVSVTGDTTEETNETVVVTLSNPANATISTATGTGTIVNDDGVTVSIESSEFSPRVTEGDSGSATLTFTVTLSKASTERVTVDYADVTVDYAGDPFFRTATSGTDYVAIAGGTLTFEAGTTSQTLDVSVTDDVLNEHSERVIVALSNATNATISTATGRGWILDNDAIPTVSIDSPSVTEGDSGSKSLTFTVTLSVASGRLVQVDYADAGTGTATSGTDYTAGIGGRLDFPAGTTSQTFDVSVTGDTDEEPDETVVVSLSAPFGVTVSTATGRGMIADDDGAPSLSINSPSVTEGDSGSKNLTFTVTLSPASGQQVTVQYADAGTGTATSATDYTAITGGTLTFAAGTTSRTFDVSVTGDVLDEADETVIATLSGATNATISTATGTGMITDDDAIPEVSIDSASMAEGDSGSTTLTFTATLSAASGRRVTVDYADTGLGNATSGTDYAAIADGTLTFEAGTTSRTFDVSVTGDTLDEVNEFIWMVLGNSVNATLGTAGFSGTITDDDPTPSLSIDSPSVAEGDSGPATLRFTATLSAASGKQVTVDWAEGTGGTATSVTDYTAITGGTLTFPVGTTNQTFDVSVTGDTDEEPNETVVATLSNATNATIATATGTGTIVNDDGVTVSIDSPRVTEGDSGSMTLRFTATLSKSSAQRVTVDYADAGTGTATSETDYTAIAGGTLTFGAGTTSQTFDVSVAGDTTEEPNETVVVTLSDATNATIATGTGTGTIVNDDGVTVSINSPSVTEGDSGTATLTFTVTLNKASADQVTVAYADAGTGTATSGTDYTAITGGTLTFAAGTTSQTFDVSVTGDGDVESNETVVVTLSNAANATIATATGTGTITDDDAPTVTLVLSSSSIDESGTSNVATVTARLSAGASEAVTLTVSATAVSPAEAGDYTQSGTLLTIAAGSTTSTGTVTVTAVDNTVDAPDKSVTVSATASGDDGVTDPAPATLTLTDDEALPTVALVLSEPDPSKPDAINESGAGNASTVTATLSGESSEAVTLTVSATAVSPAEAGDFTQSGTLLTIAARSTTSTGTVTLTAVDNAADAPDKSVTVSATASGGNTVANPDAATLTLTDDEAAPTVTLALSSTSMTEMGGVTTVSATLSHPSSAVTTVTVTPVSDFYTVGADATIVIAAGETANATDMATVTAVDDAVHQGSDGRATTVTGTASNAQATAEGETVAVTGAALTLTDDEALPTVALVLSEPDPLKPDAINESGAGNVSTVTATLSGPSSEAVTLTVSATAVAPAVAGDFTQSGTLLTIAAGSTTSTGTVTLTAVDNAVDAPDKSVTVSATAAGGNTVASPDAATLTLTDDEAAPEVTLALSTTAVTEAGGQATVNATLSHPSSAATTVTVTAGATAYTVASGAGATIVIAAGDTANASDTATITAVDNAVDAADNMVTVTGTAANSQAAANSETMTVTGASLTITDDDTAGLEVSPETTTSSRLRTTEGGGTAAFEVELGSEPTGNVVLAVASSAPTEGTVSVSSLTFTATTWSTAQTVTLTGVDDAPANPADGDRNYTVTLTVSQESTADAIYDALSAVRVYAVNADNEYGLDVGVVTGQATEAGGTAAFTVALVTRPSAAVTVTVTSRDASEGAASPSSLTFETSDWDTAQAVTVTGADDAIDDGDVTWNVRLDPSSGDADYDGLSNVDVSVTTTDDDDAPGVVLAVSPASIVENGGTATVTAALSRASGAATTVTVTTVPGFYTVGSDAVIVIAAGETAAASDTATLAAVDNATDAPDRAGTVTATITNDRATADGTTLAVSGGALTVTDDDAAPNAALSLNPASVSENGGVSTVSATLTHPSSEPTTVTVTPVSGSYTVGSDAVIVIAAGETANATDTAAVAAVDNATDEPDRTATVTATLANSQGAGTVTGATLTLEDDDDAPVLSIDAPSVTEGAAGATTTLTFTVRLGAASGRQVTVDYADAGTGTATSGTDYTAITAGTLTFAAGTTTRTIDVTVTGDPHDEADETIAIALSAPVNATLGLAAGTGTVTDDDVAPTLSIDSPSVAEGTGATGGTLTFTVSLSTASGKQVTVGYADAGTGTATSGTDYTAVTAGTLTFAANETSRTFTVSVTGDAEGEPNETIVVTLGSPTNAMFSEGASSLAGTGTIVDDDATADVNQDGLVDEDDVLVMYYAYTAPGLLNRSRLRRLVLRPLLGRGSSIRKVKDTEDGYMTMLNNAKALATAMVVPPTPPPP